MLFRLVWRNVLAHPLRSILTFLSVVLAVFLVCVLRAAVVGLSSSVEQAASNRLWVQSAVSLYVELPLSYESKIAAVEGVEAVSKWQWFGAVYRDESNFFAQFGIDADRLLQSYPEIEIIEGSSEKFQANRIGCIIGADLASEYGWGLGDRIPLIGKIFTRANDEAWEFTVEGIYRTNSTLVDQQTLYFHFDYLREALEQGDAYGPPGAGVYLISVAPGGNVPQITATVDGLFENGPQRVQTTTDADFSRQFISMLGNVPALLSGVGGAVLFAIFFAVLNTMLMAGRERVRDIGIMKALGFSDGTVFGTLVIEAVGLCYIAGLVAVGLAVAIEAPMQRYFAARMPGFEISVSTVVLGVGISLALGLVAGLVPAWVASRMEPVRALRAEA